MTDKPDNTAERRTALANAVLQPGFTQATFGKQWKVGQSTISADLKSKEFLSARNGTLATQSLRVIQHHLNANDRQTALFVAERLRLIEPDEGGTDTPAADLLRSILQPDTALRRENVELKARLADLESRVTAMNGKVIATHEDEFVAPDGSHWESEQAWRERNP